MKLLILSCNTGEGHNSAAKAVIEAAEGRGFECVMRDPMSFRSKSATKLVSGTYNGMIKHIPRAFGAMYKISDMVDSGIPGRSAVYRIYSTAAKKMSQFIQDESIDAVVCTHIFGMEAMTAVRRKYLPDFPCIGVQTDYTCVPFFAETELDRYITPHADLNGEMAAHGLPLTKVAPLGIPVSARFGNHIGRSAARKYLGVADGVKMYLFMSGGVGCGHISQLCRELFRRETGAYAAYVLAGRNADMAEELNREFGALGKLVTVPFTREVNIYMEAADVMISKPGGLSSTEAAVAGVPLVHMMTIPGCETKNVEFFSSHGMSLHAESLSDAVTKAQQLANDKSRADTMREKQRANTNARSAEDILDIVTELINRKKRV